MPVSVLLCEGGDGSPDVRLLGAIFKGIRGLEVRPNGGKDGLPGLVRGMREGHLAVCAIVDNDFPRKPEEWSERNSTEAAAWHIRYEENGEQKRMMAGWEWQRKEIENYFIDPDVVARTFGWSDQQKVDYRDRLEGVFDSLTIATAARIALTSCAPRKTRVETTVPLDANVDAMKVTLKERSSTYNERALIDGETLVDVFEKLIPQCGRGGRFRRCALDVFAGKNVLSKIQNTKGFPSELKNADALKEHVIERADASWLPEWTALRTAVETFSLPTF